MNDPRYTFSSREVLAWPETMAFLARLGVVAGEHTVTLAITLGAGESPVAVEHSFIAHRSGLSAPCLGEESVSPQPVSRRSSEVDEERFKTLVSHNQENAGRCLLPPHEREDAGTSKE